MESLVFPPGDYVSPALSRIMPDSHFPNMVIGDPALNTWPYLRRTGQQNWYVDRRSPAVGFVSRDEAHILYNTALLLRGESALEIGCWLGWSTCHLALGGVSLDVIDPVLGQDAMRESVAASLLSAGVMNRVELIAGRSPQDVHRLGRAGKRWSLVFIDGNHDFPAPVNDAVVCENYCAANAMILFHDLIAPAVAEGLRFYQYRGWHTRIFHTAQIMGVAWRGNIQPVAHIPDPSAHWDIPPHLRDWNRDGGSRTRQVHSAP
jgi:predicted O-methyltransferase YrrM